MMRGNGAQAVLVCVYGNRAYEDTLVELEDAAKGAGFRVIAAVSAIAEHSIVRQFAAGRRYPQDAAQLAGFANQIQQKISAGDASEPAIPGNRPYRKAGGAGMVPKPQKSAPLAGLVPQRALLALSIKTIPSGWTSACIFLHALCRRMSACRPRGKPHHALCGYQDVEQSLCRAEGVRAVYLAQGL